MVDFFDTGLISFGGGHDLFIVRHEVGFPASCSFEVLDQISCTFAQ